MNAWRMIVVSTALVSVIAVSGTVWAFLFTVISD